MDTWAGETSALYNQYVHQGKSFFGYCAESLVDALPLKDSVRVLDLAGGAGILSRMILEREPTAKITILDASEDQLAYARQVFGNKVTLLLANAEKFEPEEKFDIVVCANAFWYLHENIIGKISSWLDHGGVFAFNLHERNTAFKEISFFVKVNAEVDRLSREQYRRACIMFASTSDVEHLREALETAGFATTLSQIDFMEPQDNWNVLMELQARRNSPYMALSITPDQKLTLYKQAFKNIVKQEGKIERHSLIFVCKKR